MRELFVRPLRRFHRVAYIGVIGLLLALIALPAFAQDAHAPSEQPAPRIGLMTMAPGLTYWARFGHNAIVVEDPISHERQSYNYGFFDFDQPGFFLNFLRGQMVYQLVALPLDVDLQEYADEGRGVTLQWLDLRPDQARNLAEFLAWNARPENAEYAYDYFTDNCSTRVRDALDTALDGALSRQLTGSHGLTYRTEALRLGADVPWLYVGMHAGLGPFADRPLSIRGEAFVPQRLANALSRATNSEGEPLVSESIVLLPDQLGLENHSVPQRRNTFAVIGVGLAFLLMWLLRPAAGSGSRLAGASLSAAIWLICGFGGWLLLGLWGLTEHVAAYANENVLLFNPLALALLAAVPALARGTTASPLLRHMALFLMLCAALALFLRFLPFRLQNNGDFIALLGPIHVALYLRLRLARPNTQDSATP